MFERNTKLCDWLLPWAHLHLHTGHRQYYLPEFHGNYRFQDALIAGPAAVPSSRRLERSLAQHA